jgi:CRISPR-associated protein Cmr4
MFAAAECLFLYLESSLGVGSGEPGVAVDLPIQRETATGYPMIPGSTLKGVLRGQARVQQAGPELLRLLGSVPETEDRQPSCVVLSDGLPLLFPVRSLRGVFAWVTSAEAWARLGRELASYGVKLAPPPLPVPAPDAACVAPGTPLLTARQNLVLEELCFAAQPAPELAALGAWLAEHALSDEPVFEYWRQRAAHGIVVLPEDYYRYFLEHGTQITPRIRIDPRTGTAAEGALWTEEFLPPETLLFALVGANLPEAPDGGAAPPLPGKMKKAADILDWIKGLAPVHLQLGSGQTLGHGIVRVRWTGKKTVRARRPSRAKKS